MIYNKEKLPTTDSVALKLERLGIFRLGDILLHTPHRYDDETKIIPIRKAIAGEVVQVQVSVIEKKILYRPKRLLHVFVQDETASLIIKFFNFFPSQLKVFVPGNILRVSGILRFSRSGYELIHPRYKLVNKSTPLPEVLTPIYPTIAGVRQSTLRRLVSLALKDLGDDDTLSEECLKRFNLMGYKAALSLIHYPPSNVDRSSLSNRTHPAWHRLKFDELLAQQLLLRNHRKNKAQKAALGIKKNNVLQQKLLINLPFQLTSEQIKALSEIESDMVHQTPMHRLLQGDVGSGKTIVAALAALNVIGMGLQVAVMVPTEILSEQHFNKFKTWFHPLGIQLVWMTGSMKKKDYKECLDKIENGFYKIIIGTHALFQEKVKFFNLAMVIIDEQHRFGVNQRLALRKKGNKVIDSHLPHQLMMTATPIPRTLAMSYLADLDVTTIAELPPGRKRVRMRLLSRNKKFKLLEYLSEVCLSGRQVYWVCPLIEQKEESETTASPQSAEKTYQDLIEQLPGISIGLVHGKMTGDEKSQVMSLFKLKKISILVSTTVIEVGVDVPDATVMIIENAERMGLSQLHQLRGRVGRSILESTCVLIYQSPLSSIAQQRLKIIYENSDGFDVAKYDLGLRGPGEFIGVKQSGVPVLRFASVEGDQKLLETVINFSKELVNQESRIVIPHIMKYFRTDISYLLS